MASGPVCRTHRPNTWLHRPILQREESSCQLGAVHTWHLTDKPTAPSFVAYWTNNGQRAAPGLNGSAAIDPLLTNATHSHVVEVIGRVP